MCPVWQFNRATQLFWGYEELHAFYGQEKYPCFISDGVVLLHINPRPHSTAQSERAANIRCRFWICIPPICVSFLPWSFTCQDIVSTAKKSSECYYNVADTARTNFLHVCDGQTHHKLWRMPKPWRGLCWKMGHKWTLIGVGIGLNQTFSLKLMAISSYFLILFLRYNAHTRTVHDYVIGNESSAPT